MSTRSFKITYDTIINDVWLGYFATARSRWNGATGSGVNLDVVAKSTNTWIGIMTAARYPDTKDYAWLGIYIPKTNILKQATGFTIQVNAAQIENNVTPGSTQFANWVRSTATHELGHPIRLKDNPVSGGSNILMSHYRDRNVIGSPTAYDIANVKECYK